MVLYNLICVGGIFVLDYKIINFDWIINDSLNGF